MPQGHQDSQLHSSSSHHERTYLLSRQGCHKHIKTVSFIPTPATMRELTSCQGNDATSTVSFIPAPATMRELTHCQGKDATSTSRQSASFQLQPPWENLPSVKARMPQAHHHSQPHFTSSTHTTTDLLSNQECQDY
jgi:hypothetical protein